MSLDRSIPFVFLIFLAAPVFDRFIRLRAAPRFGVFAATLAMAFWIHRPADNLNPIESFVYFFNVYLFGILFCEYRHVLMKRLTRPVVISALAVVMIAVASVEVFIQHRTGNIERGPGDGWLPMGLDMMLVQKYVGVFLLCGVLARWGSYIALPMRHMAANSFGVYFVHGVLIAVLTRAAHKIAFPQIENPLLDVAFWAALVIGVSLLVIMTVKLLTGRYSRYIIGA